MSRERENRNPELSVDYHVKMKIRSFTTLRKITKNHLVTFPQN